MHPRLQRLVESIRRWFTRPAEVARSASRDSGLALSSRAWQGLVDARAPLIAICIVVAIVGVLVKYPPLADVGRGEVGVRVNRVTGNVDEWREGSVLVVPGLQQMRVFPLRDQIYRAVQMNRADGPAPLQSVEGLSLGMDLQVRYALDPARVAAMARSLPDNIGAEIVEPAVQGVVYKVFARYTVREIFSSKRAEIQQVVENELKPRAGRRRHRAARRADRQGRPAGRLQARHGGAARRGTGDREDEVHARPEGQAGQGERARRRGRQDARARSPPRPPGASR